MVKVRDCHARDVRRHAIWLLHAVLHVKQRRIARELGVSPSLIQQEVHSHFPEHCMVCIEAKL
jgi:IS30 family transposase